MSNKIDSALQIGDLLYPKGLYLATAESCTGGLLGHRITEIPGSSAYYLGGFISYAYEAKKRWLGVKESTLANHGAVSRETVLEMAAGARTAFGTDFSPASIIAVSISGIAGPAGGTPQKPVGTVWIAVSSAGREIAKRYYFKGDRSSIKSQSANQALENLIAFLKK